VEWQKGPADSAFTKNTTQRCRAPGGQGYRILDIEMQRTGALRTGPKANDMMDLGRPRLDFVALAKAMRIPATRAASVAEFSNQFQAAVGDRGPRLIEAIL
jgi:acetolactate synthase-1/2/3 large subunit